MYIIWDGEKKEKVYQALTSQTREFRHRLSFGEGVGERFNKQYEIESGITKIEISQIGNADNDGLVLGNCCSSSATIEFYNPNTSYRYNDKTVFIECGIKIDDGEYFYIPCGYYKIEKPSTDDEWKTIQITAYDLVDSMGGKWNSRLSYPSTAYLVIEEVADKYRVDIDVESYFLDLLKSRTITEAEANMLTAYKEREVVGFLVGCFGGNARINTVGKLHLGEYEHYLNYERCVIQPNVQWQNGFKKTSEEEFMIESITSGSGDNVITAGTGKGITFVNPIITEAEINQIYANYANLTFQPSTCEWRGNPCVECGDVVSVVDKNGNEYSVLVARQDIDLTGGLSITTHCPNGDADVSFDTVNEETRQALNKQYTDLQQAIVDATNKINGALGGYYEVIDADNDGNPDGWLIKEHEDSTGGLIRANKAGIALSEDGGEIYRTAITYKGINADEITSGKVKAEFIETDKLVVSKNNVSGLDAELAELLEVANEADKKAGNAQATADTASSTASVASTDASNALSVANSANGKVASWASANNTTLIDGAKIYTGSITAKQIASNSITADKLSVGLSKRENLFYNPEFTENVKEGSTTYPSGWRAVNATLSPQEGYVTFTPTSSTSRSGIYQTVWLKPGVYSVVAQVNLYRPSSVSSTAKIGYILGKVSNQDFFYDNVSLNIGNQDAKNQNKEIIVKYVVEYTGDEGFVDVGLFVTGMTFPAHVSAAWMALFNADEELMGANFYSSDASWLKTDYKTTNLLKFSSTPNAFIHSVNPFTVNDEGELDVISGNVGCLSFSRLQLRVESHISESLLGLTFDGYLDISKPTGSAILQLDSDDLVGTSKALAPSLDITSDGADRSFVGIHGYYCTNGSFTTEVTPRTVKTTGTMEALSFNNISKEETKKNIVSKSSVLNKIKSSRIYEYAYKKDGEKAKRKTGFIIERETPEEIISDDGNGINLYSMASMNWRATQEILERLESVEKAVNNNA